MSVRIPPLFALVFFSFFIVLLSACSASKKATQTTNISKPKPSSSTKTNVDGLVWFAKKQLNTPYKYASADPKNGGLDCSGFLFYVFTHFDIKVPRTSYDFSAYGKDYKFSEEYQARWIDFLMQKAIENHFEFTVAFTGIDYDKLIAEMPADVRELATIWVYTGLQRSDGCDKLALAHWSAYLKLPFEN